MHLSLLFLLTFPSLVLPVKNPFGSAPKASAPMEPYGESKGGLHGEVDETKTEQGRIVDEELNVWDKGDFDKIIGEEAWEDLEVEEEGAGVAEELKAGAKDEEEKTLLK